MSQLMIGTVGSPEMLTGDISTRARLVNRVADSATAAKPD